MRIKWLHINIAPPPALPPPMQMTDLEAQRRNRRAEERFQRRRTRGDHVGEGGQRMDGFSGEDGDGTEAEGLPGYKSDISAPVYLEEWRQQAVNEGAIDEEEVDPEIREAIRQSGPVLANNDQPRELQDGDIVNEQILSVLDYERRTRGEAPTQNNDAVNPGARTTIANPRVVEHSPDRTASVAPATSIQPLSRQGTARMSSGGPPVYDNLSRTPSATSSRH